jgi:hypothetical protein
MAQNDPFVGIWEINLAASKNFDQRQTIVNVPQPGGFKSTLVSITKDGMSRVEILPYIFDGKFHQTEGSDPREISFKRLDPNTIERTTNRNGTITVDKEELSKDGKTITKTQPTNTRVFEKKYSVQ